MSLLYGSREGLEKNMKQMLAMQHLDRPGGPH
jgi:hypothetical protein